MLISRSIHNKTLQRLRLIVAGGVSTVIRSMGNMVVAFLVVKLFSDALWGQFVFYLMMIDLAFNFVNWGHRSYLLREFSLYPDKIDSNWQLSFKSRAFILFAAITIILIVPFSIYFKLLLIAWAIARYIYQSLEPLNTYRRDYTISTFTESIGYLIIIIPILFFRNILTFETLIILYTFSYIFKSLFFSYFYRSYFKLNFTFKNTTKYFKKSLPFMLVGFSSLLVARADLYIVAAFLEKAILAQYQIFISFLLFSHFLSSIILVPFEKNIYRLKKSGLIRLQTQLVIIGIIISPIVISIIYFAIEYIFDFDLSGLIYLLGGIYIYLFFIYQLRLYQFSKNQKQQFVTAVMFIAGAVNIILGLLLIPQFKMEGAIVAAVTSQLLIASILHFKNPSKTI